MSSLHLCYGKCISNKCRIQFRMLHNMVDSDHSINTDVFTTIGVIMQFKITTEKGQCKDCALSPSAALAIDPLLEPFCILAGGGVYPAPARRKIQRIGLSVSPDEARVCHYNSLDKVTALVHEMLT